MAKSKSHPAKIPAVKRKTPVRSLSHRNEDKSKRNFEELIEPWFVNWSTRDYGTDGLVDTTYSILHSQDVRVAGKSFLVQLKSKDKKAKPNQDASISYSVEVKKFLQWISSNIPVLFVLNDLGNNSIHFLWIDESLVNALEALDPNWSGQQTVTLRIPPENVLTKDKLTGIQEYVIDFRQPLKRIIEPGRYFELKNKASALVYEYQAQTEPFGLPSINESVHQLKLDVEQSIYRIVITGMSRVGKSSFINELLKKKISPVGFFQTTGVPIQVIPGKEEKLVIFFEDGNKVETELTQETIEQYASQDFNVDNSKKVKLVSISVPNQSLQRGISVFDIPGLDDPNEYIFEYTWQTVTKANAVIYVIDAAPHKNGGFIFRREYKNNLTELGQSLDKIFLVFNKADELSPGLLKTLKERVVLDLKKHNLYDRVWQKIYYTTTINDRLRQDLDSVARVEEDMWKFILNESKSGMVRLAVVNQEIYKSTQNFQDMLNARLISHEKRKALQDSIHEVQNNIPELNQYLQTERKKVSKKISDALELQKNEILHFLAKQLKVIPLKENLPGAKEIRTVLMHGVAKTLEITNSEYASHLNQLKADIDNWVEQSLMQVREILSDVSEERSIDFSEIESFTPPAIDLSSAWGTGILSAIGGFFINPYAALGLGILGFVSNLIASQEERRAKRIVKIVDGARDRYDKIFAQVSYIYAELIHDHFRSIANYINHKLNSYFQDIQGQMSKEFHIADDEMNRYKEAKAKIELFREKLASFNVELREYN
jgi:GTPase Era involved in 16S rRNA processing